jgi:hypothetical protein
MSRDPASMAADRTNPDAAVCDDDPDAFVIVTEPYPWQLRVHCYRVLDPIVAGEGDIDAALFLYPGD